MGAADREGPDRPGRSTTRRSTVRPASSDPAIARPSSTESGVSTTSQSRVTPRATASTGSKLRARSTQATIEPADCASAVSRSASVVRPLESAPRRASEVERGTPPGPRIASSSAKPVGTTRSCGAMRGSGASRSGSGTVASAPTTSPTTSPLRSPIRCGAASPHRVRRVASAAVTSGERAVMAHQ